MSQLFDAGYLNRLAEDAEVEISNQVHCIFSRFSIAVTAGVSTYTINEDIRGIISVSWKGYPVDPLITPELFDTISFKPQNDTVQSRPLNYVRLGYGESGIKFFVAPNETLAAVSSAAMNTRAGIAAGVILTAWHVAVPCDTTYRLPEYIRRLIVKHYVLAKAFAREGKGQNLKASDYHQKIFEHWMLEFKKMTLNINRCVVHKLSDNAMRSRGKPPRPSLPPQFGEIVR